MATARKSVKSQFIGTRSAKGSLLYPVETAFIKNYPLLLSALKVSLAACVGLVFSDKSKPLSLILENPSGRGKSTIVEAFFPHYKKMAEYVYRSDSFTPKSFVTSAANLNEAARQKIDLLPKIENKYLLTKELCADIPGPGKRFDRDVQGLDPYS